MRYGAQDTEKIFRNIKNEKKEHLLRIVKDGHSKVKYPKAPEKFLNEIFKICYKVR